MNDRVSSSAAELTFHAIAVGDVYELERTFTAADVDAFAGLSGDFSPLHVDQAYAATTEFGGRVVHGMLLASLFSHLVGMRVPGRHALYLGQDLAFRRPVLVGDTVRASVKVTGKNEPTRVIALATEIRTADGRVAVSGSAKVKVRDLARAEAVAPRPAETSSAARPARTQAVALVTGSSRGIGAEIARTLAGRGMAVAVNYLASEESAERVVRDIRDAGGVAIAVQADVRLPGDVTRLVDTIASKLGRLDKLVNGATGELRSERFVDLPWTAFLEHLEYQLKGVVQVCQAAHPWLKQASGAAVVNVLSQVTHGVPPTAMADYVAAKHALHGLSKALAVEWAAEGIRVNTVSPGLTQTDLTQHYQDRVFKAEAVRTPLLRLARPADIAQAVAYLLSDEAEFLTGVDVPVTGGQVMG
jgi:3-oxoacyl-[acyl-carrier protein] reductase